MLVKHSFVWKFQFFIVFHLQLRIVVSNNVPPAVTGVATVIVNRNLHHPRFVRERYVADIPEYQILGQTIVRVNATDSDIWVSFLLNFVFIFQ